MPTKDINFRTKVTGTGTAKAKIQGVEKTAVSSAGKMGAAFAKMGAMLGIALGGAAILRLFSGSIEKFKVQELAVRKLNTALGYTTTGLQEYAASLQKVTTYGDENIINAMALIGMFVKEEDKIKKLTVATLDFAAAKGVDLAMASDLITKTFASSTNALSRYGLIVEGDAGSTERLNSLLQAMSAYGGQAEEMAKTLTGQMEQLNNKLGDQQEIIGEQLLPIWLELNKAFSFAVDVVMDNARIIGLGLDIMSGGVGVVTTRLKALDEQAETMRKRMFNNPMFVFDPGSVTVTDKIATNIERMVTAAKNLQAGSGMLEQIISGAGGAKRPLAGGVRAGQRGGISKEGGISGATEAGLSEGFKKAEQMMQNVSMTWTNILSSNFSQFWDETFGYANSLLEQLLKATFMSIFSSLLSFLPGGGILGAIFGGGGAGGALSSRGGGGAPSNIIVLKIGEEEVGSFVNKGNEYNRMRRLN